MTPALVGTGAVESTLMHVTRGISTTAVAALLVLFGGIRIGTTYRVFSAPSDEATHVGAGLELLDDHRYRLQRENPPLPRIVLAAAPFAIGMRFDGSAPSFGEQLRSVFYGYGKYERNLWIARTGNLIFFAIAAAALFCW